MWKRQCFRDTIIIFPCFSRKLETVAGTLLPPGGTQRQQWARGEGGAVLAGVQQQGRGREWRPGSAACGRDVAGSCGPASAPARGHSLERRSHLSICSCVRSSLPPSIHSFQQHVSAGTHSESTVPRSTCRGVKEAARWPQAHRSGCWAARRTPLGSGRCRPPVPSPTLMH